MTLRLGLLFLRDVKELFENKKTAKTRVLANSSKNYKD